MADRARLSPDQREAIAAARESGMTLAAIARRFQCSHGAVRWVCLMLGAEHPTRPPKARPAYGPRLRAGKPVLPFTPADDALIAAMLAQGATRSAIGRALNPPRRHNSITCRLATLARHAELEAAP